MEHIKEALEKARQERLLRQGDADALSTTAAPGSSAGPGPVVTPRVSLDEAVLRDNRILAAMPPGPFSESFNLLRTRILQIFKEHKWSTLAVTSAGPGAGKTLTAINLAISIAREVDHTVLLVDANLQQPWLLDHFGLPHRKGLGDYLAGDLPLSELLLRPGIVERLVVLPGGRPLSNSSEMLSSPKMTRLVEEMKSRYRDRIIIFDLPPLLTSSDTLAFAPQVDAALLVVEEGITRKEELEQAVDLLSVTNIVGTVLNKADTQDNLGGNQDV
jgi:exopolysaccharide/PEP-CTERM locus tyrosine autokinase